MHVCVYVAPKNQSNSIDYEYSRTNVIEHFSFDCMHFEIGCFYAHSILNLNVNRSNVLNKRKFIHSISDSMPIDLYIKRSAHMKTINFRAISPQRKGMAVSNSQRHTVVSRLHQDMPQ